MKALYSLTTFILLLAACSGNNTTAQLFNTRASLPASAAYNLDGLKVITSFVNKTKGTTSTLYGNNLALKLALDGNKTIAANEEFTLVTWQQQADDHWFGAKIPSAIATVEVIKTVAAGNNVSVNYQLLEGKSLTPNTDTLNQSNRIKYILGQKPSVMP